MRRTRLTVTTSVLFSRFVSAPIILVVMLTAQPSRGGDGSEKPTVSEPNIVYVDGQPLTLTLNNARTLTTSIPVRNIGSSAGRAEFCMLAQNQPRQDCIHNISIIGTNDPIAGGQVIVLSIRISAIEAPLSGYLGLLTSDVAGKPVTVSFRQIKVGAPLFSRITWFPIGIGFASAALLSVLSAVRLVRAKLSLLAKMGSPNWDFSKSWASNITVAGGLLSMALILAALPEQTHYINKNGYAVLNLAFAIFVGIAPFFFNVFRKGSLGDITQDGPQLQYQGYVFWFVVASGITIWAVTAQMITLIMIVNEFSFAGLASRVLISTLQCVIGLLVVGLLLYASQTIYWTARSQVTERKKALAKAAAKGVAADQLENVHTPLPDWAPL